jgi:zinc/manganese transport system ATP-binding protein
MSQHLDNALLVSRSGCIFAPIRELMGQRSPLEHVA